MSKLVRLAMVVACVFVGGVRVAQATPIAAIDISGEAAFGNGAFTLGWLFTVNQDITVTDLGYFDRNADGLVASHDVGIWTSGGALLAWTTVTNGDPLDGLFRYAGIGGLSLFAGNQYVVAGFNPSSTDGYIAASSFTTPAAITFVEGRSISGGSLAFPNNVDNTGGASPLETDSLAKRSAV